MLAPLCMVNLCFFQSMRTILLILTHLTTRVNCSQKKICEHYSEDYGVNIVTLRHFSIYGPSNNSSFLPSVVRRVFGREKVILSKKY